MAIPFKWPGQGSISEHIITNDMDCVLSLGAVRPCPLVQIILPAEAVPYKDN